jgi:hypothetical protein
LSAAPRDRLAWIGIPLGLLAFHTATLSGYGIFRDELYYLACASRLDWGYVDHPPLSILLLAVVRALLGDSVEAIRLPAALAGAATTLLAVSTARTMGGGRFAQRLAGLASAVFPVGIALTGFYSMNAFDLIFWTACLRIAASALGGKDPRLWLAFGAVAGVGLQNKISVLFLGFGVATGLLVARRTDVLRTRSLWLGGALALAIFLPHLVWQEVHDWPTLAFMENARRFKMTGTDPLGFLAEQFLNANPGGILVWLGAVAFLLVRPEARDWRPLGWAFLAIVLVLIATGAKPYYLAPAFPFLYAAGSVAWERWASRRWARAAVAALVLAGALPALPVAKAVLAPDALIAYLRASGMMPDSGERNALGALPQHFADQHGWEELTRAVAHVRDSLPEEERERVCVFGQNYGEAGAIEYFGPTVGLSRVISGHNSYWLWGPGDCGREVWIVLGDDRETLETIFVSVELAATFSCELCMPYQDDNPIWVCRDMKLEPDALWRDVRKFI